jgi:hypothetical protein
MVSDVRIPRHDRLPKRRRNNGGQQFRLYSVLPSKIKLSAPHKSMNSINRFVEERGPRSRRVHLRLAGTATDVTAAIRPKREDMLRFHSRTSSVLTRTANWYLLLTPEKWGASWHDVKADVIVRSHSLREPTLASLKDDYCYLLFTRPLGERRRRRDRLGLLDEILILPGRQTKARLERLKICNSVRVINKKGIA